MMLRQYYITIFFVLFYGAGHAQPTIPSVKLSYFVTTPPVIDGCEGDYTYDTTALKTKKYIFITNLQGLGLIRVNGKTISLQRVSQSQPAKNMSREIYKGSGYTLIIVTKEGRPSGDEGNFETGSLELKYGSEDILYKIHGSAGC